MTTTKNIIKSSAKYLTIAAGVAVFGLMATGVFAAHDVPADAASDTCNSRADRGHWSSDNEMVCLPTFTESGSQSFYDAAEWMTPGSTVYIHSRDGSWGATEPAHENWFSVAIQPHHDSN